MKVLVVDGAAIGGSELIRMLSRAGYLVDVAHCRREVLTALALDHYDVLVLDLPLDAERDILSRVRQEEPNVRVLVLSASRDLSERLKMFRLGADDYLGKPFAMEELEARVNALARRTCPAPCPNVRIHEVEIDTQRKRVTIGGDELPLTPSEYLVLEHLVMKRGRVTTPGQLLAVLHHGDEYATSNLVPVIISHLRKKLRRCGSCITTRRGFGYLID